MQLFDFELEENTEPEDQTRLTFVSLPFSYTEKERFNELCKRGMIQVYGDKAKESNAVDFLMDLLEQKFGNNENDIPTKENDGCAG